jgi:hypothetical protein
MRVHESSSARFGGSRAHDAVVELKVSRYAGPARFDRADPTR